MKKKLIAITAMMLIALIIPTIADTATKTKRFYGFTESELKALHEALANAQQINSDIATLRKFIVDPKYDTKKDANAALDRIVAQADALSATFTITEHMLAKDGIVYMVNINRVKVHNANNKKCPAVGDSSSMERAMLLSCTSREEMEALGFSSNDFCVNCFGKNY